MRIFYLLIVGFISFSSISNLAQAQVNCPVSAPTAPQLDCAAASTMLCPGQTAMLPTLTNTPELPNIEYVVTRVGVPASDGLGDEILGSSTTPVIDPAAYGLMPGEQFDVTPVAYNLTSVQTLIDNIYNNSSGIFSCCFIVGLLVTDFCPNLMATGILSGNDIQDISDVLTLLSQLAGMVGATTSIPGFLASIDGLNAQATGNLPPNCGGGLLPLCYAVGQGGGICSYTILNGTDPSCLLPLELSMFAAEALPLYNDLRWTTLTENHTAYFSIERSFDGVNFMEIGTKDAAGFSDVPNDYSFRDENPLTDLNYYRLAQIGFDGGVSYSEIVLIERDDPEDFEVVSVGPIPNRGTLTVGISSNQEESVVFRVIDITGRMHWEHLQIVAEGLNSYNLSTGHLNNGMYILTIFRPESGVELHAKFIKTLN